MDARWSALVDAVAAVAKAVDVHFVAACGERKHVQLNESDNVPQSGVRMYAVRYVCVRYVVPTCATSAACRACGVVSASGSGVIGLEHRWATHQQHKLGPNTTSCHSAFRPASDHANNRARVRHAGHTFAAARARSERTHADNCAYQTGGTIRNRQFRQMIARAKTNNNKNDTTPSNPCTCLMPPS